MPKEETTIQTKWLETLVKLAEKAEKDAEKWNTSTEKMTPLSFHRLIGYASSAKTILNLKGSDLAQKEKCQKKPKKKN